jgi:hypothetical protein
MFKLRVKPIQIIRDLDNQRPDNWSSTVVVCGRKYSTEWRRLDAVPRSERVWVRSTAELRAIKLDETYCVSYLYDSSGTTHKSADPLSGQPVNIPRGLGFRATALS